MPGLKIETPAAVDPVDLDLVKLHLHVTWNNEDDLITGYIKAATNIVEGFLGRSLIKKGYVQSLDFFPHTYGAVYRGPHHIQHHHHHRYEIKLYNPPLVSVESLKYYDTDGTLQTLTPPDDFQVDINAEPGRIMPKLGGFWPPTLYTIPNAVQIHFTAGYGDDSDSVPQNFKIAIMQIVGLYYQFREPVSNVQGANLTEIPLLENLLWNDRVLDFSPTEG